jgi:lysophospholipase
MAAAEPSPDIVDQMTEILFSSPSNPAPPNHFAGFFKSFDGMALRYAIFRSGTQVPKGTIVLLQGRNESIEKYFETIGDLNAMGLWVATFDWRGQGGSPHLLSNPRRGHARRAADYERDLDCFIESVVLPDAKLPFFLLAHSMGALMALKSAPMLANRIERMALVAPFVGGSGFGTYPAVLKGLTAVLTYSGFGWVQFNKDVRERPFEGNALTSDPQRFHRNREIVRTTPKLALGPPTARWIRVMMETIDTVQSMDHLKRITIPCLILGATQDQIVPYASLELLSQKFRAGKLLPIQGAEHEILQERDLFRNQALAAIEAFIPGSDAEPTVFSGD